LEVEGVVSVRNKGASDSRQNLCLTQGPDRVTYHSLVISAERISKKER
jgi:hypothetical protein